MAVKTITPDVNAVLAYPRLPLGNPAADRALGFSLRIIESYFSEGPHMMFSAGVI
jgi:hypothetical protein